MISPIDPSNFTARDPKDIAREILEFTLYADGPSLPSLITFYTGAATVGIPLRLIEQGAEEEPDRVDPFGMLVYSSKYLQDAMNGLTHLRDGVAAEGPEILAIKNMPALLELLAKDSDGRATSTLDIITPQLRAEAAAMSANLRGHILELFRELAAALHITLDEGPARGF